MEIQNKKTFFENEYGKLSGPEGSFLVLRKHRNDFWDWCMANNHHIEYHGSMSVYDLWYLNGSQENKIWLTLLWS